MPRSLRARLAARALAAPAAGAMGSQGLDLEPSRLVCALQQPRLALLILKEARLLSRGTHLKGTAQQAPVTRLGSRSFSSAAIRAVLRP